MANHGSLWRGQPHSSDVNHCVYFFQPDWQQDPRNEVGSLSPTERLVGLEGLYKSLLSLIRIS